MKRRINQVFNYFDQLPLEKVCDQDHYKLKLDSVVLLLKISDLFISYFIYYLFAKIPQLVIAYLFQMSYEDINFLIFLIPILFLIEAGMSNLETKNFYNSAKYFLRAVIKGLVVFIMDKLIILLLEQIN